jgi:hypothetical protein
MAEELIDKDDYMASFELGSHFFHMRLKHEEQKYFGFAIPAEDDTTGDGLRI